MANFAAFVPKTFLFSQKIRDELIFLKIFNKNNEILLAEDQDF